MLERLNIINIRIDELELKRGMITIDDLWELSDLKDERSEILSTLNKLTV
jgi:hypothetical protein